LTHLVFCLRRLVGANSHLAYFLSDCVPVYLLYGVGCLLYTVPIYTMAGLRRGLGK
jgi:hypothetical protein